MSIPNFLAVDEADKIYRGGQPVTPEDWQSLNDLGIVQVTKLNEDSEGSDEGAISLGIPLYKVPISVGEQIIPGPSTVFAIHNAVAFITHGTFIHCEHGQDRTGVVCAIFRMWKHGWPKSQAEEEMFRLGFHKELFGLWEAWEHAKERTP